MKAASSLLSGLILVGAALAPSSEHHRSPPQGAGQPSAVTSPVQGQDLRRALANLEMWTTDLRKSTRRGSVNAAQSTDNLWMEVNQLKRGGQNVRALEYYLSDLEGSMRPGYENDIARRHALNNLELELDLQKRGLR